MIRLTNYSFYFPGKSEPALSNINLSVNKGDWVLILGPCGSGKSLLLYSIMGIIPHVIEGKIEGNISVLGKDVSQLEVRQTAKNVGIIYQDPDSQLCELIVEDEVAFGLCLANKPREEMQKEVSEALKITGLEKYRDKEVHYLSGGEKQRLAIASALAIKPDILLLDAPTSNLDSRGALEVLSFLNTLRETSNMTLLIVEYKVDELFSKANKLVVMDQGKIIHQGNPREIVNKHGLELRDKMGLWLPQVTEIALELREKFDGSFPEVPVTIDEFVNCCGRTKPISTTFPKQPPRNVILSVKDLHFTYGQEEEETLKGINLEVGEGEWLALVGQNGSGKTTLSMNLVGLLKPSSGTVLYAGKDMAKMPVNEVHKAIAYVFQYPDYQFTEKSVFEELGWYRRKKGITEDVIEKEVTAELEKLKLLEFKHAHPYSLSMGQKRTLSVQSVIDNQPKIIILDEPTYGLDWKLTRELMAVLKEANRGGTSIVYISHDMKLVAEFSDRAAVISGGEIIFDGEVCDLFQNTEVLRRAYLIPPAVVELSKNIKCPQPLAVSNQQFEESFIRARKP